MARFTDSIRLERRRRRYAPTGSCQDCGSTEDLVWDHIDPESKFRDISRMIQSYPDAVIERELAKCEVRCRTCNTKKGRITNRLTPEQVMEVRRLLMGPLSDQEIADQTGIGRGTIWRIRVGESWRE